MGYIRRCTDPATPAESRAFTLPFDLYFAADSKTWGPGHGVAFIDDAKTGICHGRIYRISRSQFSQIRQMEGAKYTKLITDNGGEIVYEEDWGLRQLAYPIQHKTSGFYYLIQFQADPSFVEVLETQYFRDERIIRFLTVALDKDAGAYAEKRRASRSRKAAAQEAPQETEAAAPAEQPEVAPAAPAPVAEEPVQNEENA